VPCGVNLQSSLTALAVLATGPAGGWPGWPWLAGWPMAGLAGLAGRWLEYSVNFTLLNFTCTGYTGDCYQ
jgi:hypothetical protein